MRARSPCRHLPAPVHCLLRCRWNRPTYSAPDNLTRLAGLVAELGGHVQLGESLLGSERSIAALLRQGERALISTRLGDLDVAQGLDGVPSYAELRMTAIDVDLAGVTIAICGLEDLRAMKRAAGRPRDLVDLDDLDAAQPGPN